MGKKMKISSVGMKNIFFLTLPLMVLTVSLGVLVSAKVTPLVWYQENRNLFVPSGQTKSDTRTYTGALDAYAANFSVDPAGSPYSKSWTWNAGTYKLKVTITNNHQDTIQVFWTNYYYMN